MNRRIESPLEIFIEGWGRMGACWGLGKVTARIHALLYLSTRPLSLEEMSETLKTSRSNISLNVRTLQDLGVVKKVILPGDRRDYYTAEENTGKVLKRLAAEKKKRELDPALEIVRRAIHAAEDLAECRATDAVPPPIDPDRLRTLQRLMVMIGGIFDAFIEDETVDGGARTTVGTHNL